MTVKEKACNLINAMPDNKVYHVVRLLSDLAWLSIEEEEPDEFDLKMIREYEESDDKEFMSLDNYLKEAGINPDEL